jgi:hypothetical protein
MGFDQYHEPPHALPSDTWTLPRVWASPAEESEVIGWYRICPALEFDPAVALTA